MSLKITDYLPHLQLLEIMTFMQIGFGNPYLIGELIGLRSYRQAHVSPTLNFFGAVKGFRKQNL